MKKMLILLSALFLVAANQDIWAVVQYTVTPLGVQSGIVSCYPTGLNNAGVVVGEVRNEHGYCQVGVSQDNTMVSLGNFGRTDAWAQDINDNGQIIGTAQQSDETYYYTNEAFTLKNGTPTFLGMLSKTGQSGEGSWSMDINNAGQIVGTSTTGESALYHGILWENGTMTDIGTPPGTNCSGATAINSSGTVIGWAGQDDGAWTNRTAFTWTKTEGFHVISNTLGTGSLYLADINDSGQMVGVYNTTPQDTPGSQTKPFYYDGTTMVDLPMPLGAYRTMTILGMNNREQIVGYLFNENNYCTPLLWENGQVYEIDSLIPTGLGPFDWSYGADINDQGQIITQKVLSDGVKGYLLTPVPEPSTFALLGMGLIGLLGWAWRRKRSG